TILERLAPHHHARENSHELGAAPLFHNDTQWYYFRLLERCGRQESADHIQVNAGAGLTQESLRWLGNVPIEQLVELRRRNENQAFRARLAGYVEEVAATGGRDDLQRTASNVERGVRDLLAQHQQDIAKIVEEYQVKHAATAVGAWLTF